MEPKDRVFWIIVLARSIAILLTGAMILLLILMLSGCSRYYCTPSKGSADYAVKQEPKHLWRIDRIVNNGAAYAVYLHRFEKGARIKRTMYGQCLPDSFKIGLQVIL